MLDELEREMAVAVIRIADALERLGDVIGSHREPKKETTAPVVEPDPIAEEAAPAKKKRAKKVTKRPAAQTTVEAVEPEDVSLKELTAKAKAYAKGNTKNADKIRKFLAKHDCTKLSGLDAESRTELAANLSK